MAKQLKLADFCIPPKDYHCLSGQPGKDFLPIWHYHDYYELEILTVGTSIDEINGTLYVLNRGDFIFLQPDDIHCIQGYKTDMTHLINLSFSVTLIEEIFSFLEFPHISSISSPITGHLPQELISPLIKQTNELMSSSGDLLQERSLIKQWMTVCLMCSNFTLKSKETQVLPTWMLQLMAKLKTPEGFSGGIEYLKLNTDRSYPHVCRSFKKYLLQTPTEWINEQRLIYSASLLLHTEQSILEISLECGFHNLSHFNHLFKAFFGITPSTMRSLLQNETVPINITE